MEFSFNDIVALFRKRFILIVVVTFVGFCSFFIINQYILKPYYTASVQMYVNPNETTVTADLNELYYAKEVVTTYINFLQTKVFYTQVLEESKLDYTLEELKSITKINAVNSTEIFQISVTTYSAEDSYELVKLMQQIAPIMIKGIKSSAEISVVDPVTFPMEPSGPNTLLNTMAGGLSGFLLSVLISVLSEMIDVNVKNVEELSQKYHKPILGVIPSYVNSNKRKYLFLNLFQRKRKKNTREVKSLNEDTKFIITEAYKALRTNLRYSLYKDGCKKVLINSPMPEDGKSTTCSHVGITLAQTGASVLLIDCDLRKGKLHSFFNIKSYPGTSDILSGMAKENEVIQNTSFENLQVIAMGSIPPNPTELLAGTRMEELMKELEKYYDYIILDSPPVNVVSDALSLVKLVEGIIIIVREERTSHPNIASAISKYEFVEARILGFVLNGIRLNQGNKSRYQHYYKKSHND